MLAQKPLLLLRRQLDGAPRVVRLDGREDLPVGAEIRMVHMRTFDGALHAKRNATKRGNCHVCSTEGFSVRIGMTS
jgi:hypothetical protein